MDFATAPNRSATSSKGWSRARSKIKALQKKAEQSQAEMKATLDARAGQIRNDYEQTEARLKHLVAEQLKAAAARLEK